ncbi:hypothetical protein MMC30_002653 [Trapelia coarctata]|nr:hypothetical protein [Trapelia coarctata]
MPKAFLAAAMTQRSGTDSGEGSDKYTKTPSAEANSSLVAVKGYTRSRTFKRRRDAHVSRGTVEPQTTTTDMPRNLAVVGASTTTSDSSKATSPQNYSSDEERQSSPRTSDTPYDESPVAAALAAAQTLRQAAVALNQAAEYIIKATNRSGTGA